MKQLSDGSVQHDLAAVRRKFESEPLSACPLPLRHPVWRVWVCHQHLFPSVMPLAAAVGLWVREGKLAIDDAIDILDAAVKAEQMAKFKFASDLLTFLAYRADEATKARRAREEEEKRKAAQTPGDPAAVRPQLQEYMRRWSAPVCDPEGDEPVEPDTGEVDL